jgi:hypothetical protein
MEIPEKIEPGFVFGHDWTHFLKLLLWISTDLTTLHAGTVATITDWSVHKEQAASQPPILFVVKGPAADATDAPQPRGLLCNRVKKKISFFSFFRVMEHRWNEIDGGKPKYWGKTLSQCHSVDHKSHMDWPGIEPGLPPWEAGH